VTVVLDTNVLIAAFATRGLCQSVFELCLDRHRIAISEHLMQELKRGLSGKVKLPADLVVQIDAYVRSVGDLVEPTPLPAPVCRDRDDDEVLALALSAEASMLVTGDRDLLDLREHRGIEVVSPRMFWDRQRAG
jgi:putative PIN family toxin of toxin-antitoxin system